MNDHTDANCVFCRIVAGMEPASMVHQDEVAVAFMDIRPATPGHLLVVPRYHCSSFTDLDPGNAAHLMRIAEPQDAALRASGLRCQGVNLFLADGEAAGQDVFHVHLHLIPRFEGDGMRITAQWTSPSRAELDETAAGIRSALISPGQSGIMKAAGDF
jgi:histidine triad (HIT) family protein